MKFLIITQKVNKADPVLGFFHRWIYEFSKKCDKVIVLCLEKGAYDLPQNVEVVSMGKEIGGSKISYLSAFFKAIWGKRNEYDSVLVHMNPIYCILGFPIWKMLGKKTGLWYVHKHVDLKLRLAVIFVDKVFTASKESFRLKSKKVVVTGHGIDVDIFVPRAKNSQQRTIVGSIGRISETKDLEFMAKSIAMLPDSIKENIMFEIVGKPKSEEEKKYEYRVRSLVKALGLEHAVAWKGSIENSRLVDYLSGLSLTLNVSRTESLDKAVLESMACGIPVLTTNVAFREMLSPFKLFVSERTEENYAKHLADFMLHPQKDVSAKIREIIVRNHSLGKLIPVLLSHYEETSR
jgi:glycosyltransferase involved in cell wall biosynthesis